MGRRWGQERRGGAEPAGAVSGPSQPGATRHCLLKGLSRAGTTQPDQSERRACALGFPERDSQAEDYYDSRGSRAAAGPVLSISHLPQPRKGGQMP